MPRGKDSRRRALQERIETQHQQIMARCFGVSGNHLLDPEVAEKYAGLVAEIAKLPRDRLMALRFLPEAFSAPAAPGAIGAPPRPRERAVAGEELVLFRRMAEASGSGFFVTNLKGEISYINPALSRLLAEPTPSHAIGRSMYDFYTKEDSERLLREVVPAAIERRQWNGELTLRTIQGRHVPTIQNLFIVHGEADQPPYLANLIVDISDRKRAEEALRQSEERFRSVFDHVSIGIYRTTPDGRILMANQALVKMLGYESFPQLAERNLEQEGYEPRYSRERFKGHMSRQGEVRARESAWLRQDGAILYVRESARAIRDDNGNTLYYEGTVEDVTDRKRAEEALRASEENFRALAQNANDGILIAGGDGRHIFANRRACEITGYSREELLAMGFRQLAPPEEHDMLAARYQRRIAGESAPPHYETEIVHKQGHRVPIEVTAARTTWEGRVADIVIVRDISARKAAEAALHESEEKYRNLVENVHDILYATDCSGNVTYISPSVTPTAGYDPQEILGKTIDHFVHSADLERARENIRAILAGHFPEPHEYRLRFKSGEYRWVRISSRPIVMQDKVSGVRGVISEIHDLKTTQLALQESERQYIDLLEKASDGIGIAQGQVLEFVNSALARLLGYQVDELLGKPFTHVLAPVDTDALMEHYEAGLRVGHASTRRRFRVRCKDGTLKWVEVAGSIVTLRGRPAALGIVREIGDPQEQDREHDSP